MIRRSQRSGAIIGTGGRVRRHRKFEVKGSEYGAEAGCPAAAAAFFAASAAAARAAGAPLPPLHPPPLHPPASPAPAPAQGRVLDALPQAPEGLTAPHEGLPPGLAALLQGAECSDALLEGLSAPQGAAPPPPAPLEMMVGLLEAQRDLLQMEHAALKHLNASLHTAAATQRLERQRGAPVAAVAV